MESLESVQQKVEKFARDFNLSEEDIREIENNEGFKRHLYFVLKSVPENAKDKFRIGSFFHVFRVRLKQRIHLPGTVEDGYYGLGRELFHKITTNYPDDLTHWLDPIYRQGDNFRLPDAFLRLYSQADLQKYEQDLQDYERACEQTNVAESFDIWEMSLASAIASAILFIVPGLAVVQAIAAALKTGYEQWSWYTAWASASAIYFIVCFIGVLSLCYLETLWDCWRNKRIVSKLFHKRTTG